MSSIGSEAESEPGGLPEHVAENRRHWDEAAKDWVAMGERAWAATDPSWGIWSVPEVEVEMLPVDMGGLDAIELGCGTGYVSAWMARRGATVTAVDNSEAQLATARRLAAEHGLDITFIHGNAETVPLPDGSFDFAINEYGACHLVYPRGLAPGGPSPAAPRRAACVPGQPPDGFGLRPARRWKHRRAPVSPLLRYAHTRLARC